MNAVDVAKTWAPIGSVIWAGTSGILNIFFWFKSPEEWISFAEKNPRAAAFMRLVRGWGFDPIKGLYAIRDLAKKRTARGGDSVRAPPMPAPEDTLPGNGALPKQTKYLNPMTDSVHDIDAEALALTKKDPPQ